MEKGRAGRLARSSVPGVSACSCCLQVPGALPHWTTLARPLCCSRPDKLACCEQCLRLLAAQLWEVGASGRAAAYVLDRNRGLSVLLRAVLAGAELAEASAADDSWQVWAGGRVQPPWSLSCPCTAYRAAHPCNAPLHHSFTHQVLAGHSIDARESAACRLRALSFMEAAASAMSSLLQHLRG